MTLASAHAPAAKVPAEGKAAATRARILDAAEAEFAARGYAGSRLKDIAEAASVKTALIHHYFSDKEGLYREVIDRAMRETSERSWSLITTEAGLGGLIAGFVDMLADFYEAHHNLLAMMRHEKASGSTLATDMAKAHTRPIVAKVARLLEGYKQSGAVRADVRAADVIVAALSLVFYPRIDAPILEAVIPGARATIKGAAASQRRSIVRMLLAMLAPEPPAAAG